MKKFFRCLGILSATVILVSCGQESAQEAYSYNFSSKSSCDTQQLKICLANAGGQACYAKWSCNPGDEKGVNLQVPYYYQLNNKNEPYRSCNITSVAMALSYKTRTIKPDTIYQKYGLVFTGHEMAAIARAYGAKNSTYHAGSVGIHKVKSYLDRGIPVIFQGQFTSGSGHIILIVGYDESGWIVNDPYGEWFSWGYQHDSKVGNHVHYSYDLVDRNSLGGRGNYHITAVY